MPNASLQGVLPDGYRIRELAIEDAPALAESYWRNREHLAPWDSHRGADFYTTEGQAEAVATQLAAMRSASVGYWIDARHQGRGLATGALECACAQALERGLHRVEAGTMVHNEASQRVLLRCGFELYGLAPKFFFVAGAWQDHQCYQRILHNNPL